MSRASSKRTRPPAGPSLVRTVEVLPPSRSDEGTWVLLSAAFVVLCVIYVVAFQRLGGSAGSESTRSMLPFQVLFRDLPSTEQREFRQMQEGFGEAMAERGRSGAWASAEALGATGVPPFAPDVLDRTGLRWSQRRDGLLVQYVGLPAAGSGAPAYMIFVQEPDPVTGEKVDPKAATDEEHQVLRDGTLLHVTYWKRGGAVPSSGVVAEPALQGWSQIRLTNPFEKVEKP